MKNKIFNFYLFKESFKQNKLPGIIMVILSVVISAIAPIINMITPDKLLSSQIEIPMLGVAAIGLMYLAPFVLIFNQFSFLNKRNSSDIYHSMPFSRTCMSVTMFVSVVMWEIAIIVPAILITSLLFVISGAVVNLLFIPYIIFSLFAGYLLLSATSFIAVHLSGTMFSSIITTFLITAMPRFIIDAIMLTSAETIKIASIADVSPIFNDSLNIPIGSITQILLENGYKDSYLKSIDSIVYTTIIALICFCIGIYCAKRRPSETALKNAPSRLMQNVFRCSITFPWIMIIVALFVLGNIEFSVVLVIMILAVLTFVVYELITTKKFKNVIKALPQLAVLGVIGVAIYFGLLGVNHVILNDIPKESDIKSISFSRIDYKLNLDYNSIEVQNIKFIDENLNKLVINNLNTTVQAVKGNDLIAIDKNGIQLVTMNLKNGRKVKRKIYFSEDNYSELTNIKNKSTEFDKAIKSLPTVSEIKLISLNGSTFDKKHQKEVDQIWESFRDEYSRLSSEEIIKSNIINSIGNEVIQTYNVLTEKNESSEHYDTSRIEIMVKGNKESENFIAVYNILEKTPKTFKLYKELSNKIVMQKLKTTLRETKLNENAFIMYRLTLDNLYSNNKDDGKYFDYTNIIIQNEQYKKELNGYKHNLDAENMILKIVTRQNDMSKATTQISFMVQGETRNNKFSEMQPYYSYNCYVNLTPEEEKFFNELHQKQIIENKNENK